MFDKINLQYFMFRHWLYFLPEKIYMKIAWIMPKQLVKMCAIRVGAHATTGKYSNQVVPELTFMDAIERWDK